MPRCCGGAEKSARKLALRRSVRHFSPDPVPRELIELAIQTASTAPSGAHRQPWRFVAVSDPAVKREIRLAAEAEERQTYEGGRMPDEWREALAPLGTDWHKPFLEIAPWIVVVFEEAYRLGPNGEQSKNYYVKEERGHRVRSVHRRVTPHGPGDTHAHAQPDGFPLSNPRPARERKALRSFPDWFSR